jgi:conjugal transfer ATP-binding protein TraC
MASFRYNGIELFSTKYLHMQSFLATLPFMVSEGLYEDLLRFQRFRKLTTWNLANLLPLVSDPKISVEGAIFPSFRHQLSMLDIFNAPGITNYNMAVAAASGAGKTFLIQMLVLMMLSRTGKVWAIDLGDSYRKSCQIFNGTYLTADNLKLNPFSIVINIEESLEQIADLYAIMASPTETMGDVKKAYLMEAIKNAFLKKEHQAKVDHVVEELQTIAKRENEDRRAYDLVTVLKKYMTDGTDGIVFNEASELAPNASFVVLELGGLKNKPTLLKAVLFALILSIQNEMYRSNFKGKKMCIIDEAWEFLGGNNKEAADFIERGYRTSRKHNGSFVTITQAVRDYHRSEESHAAWNNSDIKIIMRQDAKAFETFIKENADFYTPYQQTLIRSFRPAKENGFSEFMLCLGGQSSFHRLFVDPFSRIMFSSAKNEVDAVRALEEQGIPLFDAIERVAQQVFPEEMS